MLLRGILFYFFYCLNSSLTSAPLSRISSLFFFERREMDDNRKVNIMSVELALKRELAYQKKLARLYPEDDCTNELSPPEVPFSNITSGAFPSSTHMSGPHSISFLNNMGPSLYSYLDPPLIPRMQSHDPIPYPWPNMETPNASIHLISKEKSAANSFQYLPNPWSQPIYINNSTNFFCKVCQVSCSGPVSLKQHIRGQKHRANLQKQQPTRNTGGANSYNQLKCDSSNILFGEDYLEIRLNGQKRKAQEVGLRQTGRASQQLWCQLCQVACSHEDAYRLHVKGKSHATKLQALGKK